MVAAEANDRQGTVGTNPAAKADSAAIEAALAAVRWGADGLIAAIAQDADDGTVLMVAWMNREALAETLHSGRAVYWSRSRQQLWRKGESSGHEQQVVSVHLDCDGDAVLLRVRQQGGIACHTGRKSCFYREWSPPHGWCATLPVLKDPKEIYR
ncbi:MAG TPA: phosphoribosyl-AMP cyclohydrolase [Hydrogenophilus thermoluteolus]|nr:phosphoribosyl-AMP cyclohydrolase [Hydrogenophilus thermoluteolus]